MTDRQDVNVSMGEVRKLKLGVVSSIKRMCKVYTDKPKMILFEDEYKTQFEMFPNTNNMIFYKLRSFKPGQEKVSINCVDNFSKELVQGWTLLINTQGVEPDQILHFSVGHGRTEPLESKPFINRLNEFAVYDVESSDPSILQILPESKLVKVEANSKIYINMRAITPNMPGSVEAHVYISEVEGKCSEYWKVILDIN